jgi:hypothetical protein
VSLPMVLPHLTRFRLLGFPGESEKFCTLDDISLLDKHLRALSTNAGIPLANLLHPSKADIYAQDFPGSAYSKKPYMG